MNALAKTESGYRLAGVQTGNRWTGMLYYGDVEIGSALDMRSEKDLDKWAHALAAEHKASLAPEKSHTFVKTFVL